jgi:hypothetical protein
MIIKFVIICVLIIQMPPQTHECFLFYLRKTVCEFMSIMSSCHLVSYNALMSSLYCFSCDSKNKSALVLNSFRTFHVLKVKSFSLYVSIPSEVSLSFSQLQLFYRVKSASRPTHNPQPGGPGYLFTSASSPVTCPAWEALPVAALPSA